MTMLQHILIAGIVGIAATGIAQVILSKLKVGDKVRFVAANPAGTLTVTSIQLAQK